VKGAISMPPAKVVALYGAKDVWAPFAKVTKSSESFKEEHTKAGKVAEVLSWSMIGLGLATLGMKAKAALESLGWGEMISTTIAYTSVFVHPSIVSSSIQSVRRIDAKPGMSEYFRSYGVSEIPACPVFFGLLGALSQSASEMITVGRAIAAAIIPSVMAWAVAIPFFAIHWARRVRGAPGGSVWGSMKSFFRGAFHPFREQTRSDAYEEAGKMVGFSFLVYGLPRYAMRMATAAFVALQGTGSGSFADTFIKVSFALVGLETLLEGVKNSKVEQIIGRANSLCDEGQSSDPP